MNESKGFKDFAGWYDTVQKGAPFASWVAFWGAIMSAKQKPFFYDYLPPDMQKHLDTFHQQFAQYESSEVIEGLQKEAFSRFHTFMGGFQNLWQQAEAAPDTDDSKNKELVIWQQGSSKLLDLGKKYGVKPGGPSLLMIPSLLNRGWIFDLKTDHSLAKFMALKGIRPLVLEWGEPQGFENYFDLKNYHEERLIPLMTFLMQHPDMKLFVLGYCMGALMALTALSKPYPIKGLALLAPPWDFSAMPQPPKPWRSMIRSYIDQAGQQKRSIPANLIQGYFQMLAWPEITQKARSWQEAPQDFQEDMLPLERWLQQGYSLTHKVAQDCYESWYMENRPHHHQEIAGKTIDFKSFNWPVWMGVGQKDQVVPPAASHPLKAFFQKGTFITPDVGHLGLFSSKRAPTLVWEPLREWILKHYT